MDKTIKELETILEHLKNQLISLESDDSFHKNLIELISNNPKQKEIIQFIVDINDKLETRNEVFKDAIYDSLHDLITVKIKLVKVLLNKPEPKHVQMTNYIKSLFTPKIILICAGIAVVVITFIITPDKVIELVNTIGVVRGK